MEIEGDSYSMERHEVGSPSGKWLTILSVLVVTTIGCSSVQESNVDRTKKLLAIAGFELKVAQTDEQFKKLNNVAQRKLTTYEKDGKSYYIYADAEGCNCVYVGTDKNYKEYTKIRGQQIDLNVVQHRKDTDLTVW